MTGSDNAAEIADATETLAHYSASLATMRAALAEQIARTSTVYGDDRHKSWPASSYHAVTTTENEVAALDARIVDVQQYLAELTA